MQKYQDKPEFEEQFYQIALNQQKQGKRLVEVICANVPQQNHPVYSNDSVNSMQPISPTPRVDKEAFAKEREERIKQDKINKIKKQFLNNLANPKQLKTPLVGRKI